MWSLVAGIIGAVAALLLREGLEWCRRPSLKIDFEKVNGHQPYILDLFLPQDNIAGKAGKAKAIRLNVRNAGRRPAMNCEAKMVIFKAGKKEASTPLIHWARRDPAVYKTLDQIYAPIHLNKSDEEALDLLMLRYYAEDPDLPGDTIGTISPREYSFERNVTYHIRVTVYASNAISKPFALKLCWDGTRAGFDRAVQRIERIEDVQGL